MGHFNINLLNIKTCHCSKDFLLSLQSYSFIPPINNHTRVYKNSASLIDNILVNKTDSQISYGNIASDVSDHYFQFCVSQPVAQNLILKCLRFGIIPASSKNVSRQICCKFAGTQFYLTRKPMLTNCFLDSLLN